MIKLFSNFLYKNIILSSSSFQAVSPCMSSWCSV